MSPCHFLAGPFEELDLSGANAVTMRNCGKDLDCRTLAYAAERSKGARALFERCCEGKPDAGMGSEGADTDVWLSRVYDLVLPDEIERQLDQLAPDNPVLWYDRRIGGVPVWALGAGLGVLVLIGIRGR